jgi:hypothetical protein
VRVCCSIANKAAPSLQGSMEGSGSSWLCEREERGEKKLAPMNSALSGGAGALLESS